MRFASSVALSLAGILCHPGVGMCQAAPDSSEDPKVLAAAVSVLREGLVRPLDDTALASRSVAELIRRADPDFGEYLTPQDLDDLRRGRRSHPSSFGLLFRRQKGLTTVVPRVPGPAADAGILPGDKLEKLEGQEVRQKSLPELDKLLSSLQRVTLTVRRGDSLEVVTIHAIEPLDSLRSVQVEWPAPDILLLRLPQLLESTLQESADALTTHWRGRSLKGIILDLRGNPGGQLVSAIGHASIFLPSNSLVAMFRSNSRVANGMRVSAKPDDYLRRNASDPLAKLPVAAKTVPLAVLVDESTSSGAELIAAALQAHKRGLVFGRRTSGIATIQTFSFLPNDGAIKYTSAYWEPSTGRQIDEVGVIPDEVVAASDPRAVVAAALTYLAKSAAKD